MDTLAKLRAKKLQRQAAENNVEALISEAPSSISTAAVASRPVVNLSVAPTSAATPSISSTATVAPATSQTVGEASKLVVAPAPAALTTLVDNIPKKRPAPAAEASEMPSFAAQLKVVGCPTQPHELRSCLLHFICGSSSFGPLPMNGVALNASLRREFMRAGHDRSRLAVFRASATVEALRGIHRDLASAGGLAVGALMFEEDGDDLLIVEADPKKISRALLEKEQASGSDWVTSQQKRLRQNSSHPGQLALMPYPGEAQMGLAGSGEVAPRQNGANTNDMASVEALLKAPTAKQRQLIDAGDELRQLLAEPTAKQSLTASKFMNKSRNMASFCPHGSRHDCRRAQESAAACSRIHFKKIIKPWTDESLGDCSYLDTCRHIDKCKYVHYALDLTVDQAKYLNECGVHNRGTDTKRINALEAGMQGLEIPAQWVQCDIRKFPLNIFNGLIDVVMADPPWDIHMELPYGTLTDDEVRNLKIGDIHKDGVIFLWVTGRAMELARDCFRIWGYRRIEEIIWVKTNQLQRIIRTGRTGHWINHSKEHCLVGIKGNPRLNRNLDCDVIVSEVRETSRKPDEIYNLIERMFPNCMKLELFGRPHNVHENWITCGNQLDGVRLCDDEIVRRYNVEYPDAKIEPWTKEREAVVPVFASNGKPGGITSEDAPWIPPSAAPPPMQGPVPNAPRQPSSKEAWIPPSQPPSGCSGEKRPASPPSSSYPPSFPPGYPPGYAPPGYPPGYAAGFPPGAFGR